MAVQVKRLAQSALGSGVDNQNKAQSCLILARACHADGQIQEAVSWYSQASIVHFSLMCPIALETTQLIFACQQCLALCAVRLFLHCMHGMVCDNCTCRHQSFA